MSIDTGLIYDVKRKMLAKYPRFGSEIAVAHIEFRDDLPMHTAATDGKNIYVDPNYFESLSENDRLFTIAHEIMHIKFMHMYRLMDKEGKRRDPELWNIATDAIINANLERDGFTIKEGYVNMPEALNYSAEEFYQKLLQEKEKQQQEQSNGQNQEQGEGEEQDNQQNSDNNGQGQGQEQEQDNQQGSGNNEQGQEQDNQQENGQGKDSENSDEDNTIQVFSTSDDFPVHDSAKDKDYTIQMSSTSGGFPVYDYANKKYPDIVLKKIDTETKGILPGAVFTLHKDDKNGSTVSVATTGEDGKLTFKNVPPGDYYLVESTAPKGYVKSELKYPIHVLADGSVITGQKDNGSVDQPSEPEPSDPGGGIVSQ